MHPFPPASTLQRHVELHDATYIEGPPGLTDEHWQVDAIFARPQPATQVSIRCEYDSEELCSMQDELRLAVAQRIVCPSSSFMIVGRDGRRSLAFVRSLSPNTTDPLLITVESRIVLEACPPAVPPLPSPSAVFFDAGGAYKQLAEVLQASVALAAHEHARIPQGFLLSGPPGVGKTFCVRRISQDTGVPLVLIDGPELLSPLLGQSEAGLSAAFARASQAAAASPSRCAVLFIDEIVRRCGARPRILTCRTRSPQRESPASSIPRLLCLRTCLL